MKRLMAWLWTEFRRPVAFIAYVHGPLLMLTGFVIAAAPYLEPLLGGTKPPQEAPLEEARRAFIGGLLALGGFLLERWGRRHATAWEGILLGVGYAVGGPLIAVFILRKDHPEMSVQGVVFMCAFFIAMGAWTLRWGLAKRRDAAAIGR